MATTAAEANASLEELVTAPTFHREIVYYKSRLMRLQRNPTAQDLYNLIFVMLGFSEGFSENSPRVDKFMAIGYTADRREIEVSSWASFLEHFSESTRFRNSRIDPSGGTDQILHFSSPMVPGYNGAISKKPTSSFQGIVTVSELLFGSFGGIGGIVATLPELYLIPIPIVAGSGLCIDGLRRMNNTSSATYEIHVWYTGHKTCDAWKEYQQLVNTFTHYEP